MGRLLADVIGGRRTRSARTTLVLLLALLLTIGTACGLRPVPGIIKIGLVAPLGGSDSASGLQLLFAVRLALREWNANGGIDGFRVDLTANDDRGAGAGGEQQARALAIDPGIVGVIGHVTAASALAAAPHYEQSGLALITFANVAGWSNGTPPSTTFRLAPPPAQWARALADLASRQAKADSAIIVHEPGPDDEAFVGAVEEALHSTGILTVRTIAVSATQSGYDQAAQAIAEQRPGAIILATNFVTAGEIAAQLRPLTTAPLILAPQAGRPEILRIGGAALEGAYTLSPAFGALQGEKSQQFIEDYRQLAAAVPGDYSALAYDATNLLLTAARSQLRREGHIDRAGVLRELALGDPLEGLTGSLAFDQQRSRRNAMLYAYQLSGFAYPGRLLDSEQSH